jgi:hypothetical protein
VFDVRFLLEIQAIIPETSPNGCAEQLFSNVHCNLDA